VAWLHETLGRLSEDLAERLEHLHVIRSTRAIAAENLSAGELVSLQLDDGLLTARTGGRGPSRGRVRAATRQWGLVEVTDLEGIVPVQPTRVSVRTLSEADLDAPETPARLRTALGSPTGLVAALGLEAYALLVAARVAPVERFAVAEVGREAARIGVPVTIVVTERDLPRLLKEFATGAPPALEVSALFVRRGRGSNSRTRSRSS
jgi:predicted transcriptional regulator